MKHNNPGRRAVGLVGLLLVILVLYLVWARPYQQRWGATDDELGRTLPGDALNSRPTFLATRAITIDGTAEEIWPWLIQMGYGRAGLYGFDLFEKVGNARGMQGTERILPQYQDFGVGDIVPVSPVSMMIFQEITLHESIVWFDEARGSAVTWALFPMDGMQTRLVVRTRWSHHWLQPGMLSLDLLTEFTDHVAMREVLQGVKGRVEGDIKSRSDVNIVFFIHLGAWLVFLWGAISVVRLPLTWTSWLVGLAGGITWLITWYAPASIWIGATLSLLVVWAVRIEFRDVRRSASQEEVRAPAGVRRKRM